MNSYFKSDYEIRLLRYGLILAIVLQSLKLIHNIYLEASSSVFLVSVITLMITIGTYYFHQKYTLWVTLIFYLALLTNNILLWNNTGGAEGMAPFSMITVTIFILLTSHGWVQYMSLIVYGIVMILLFKGWIIDEAPPINSNYSQGALAWDFIRMTLAATLLTAYIKRKFFQHKDEIGQITKHLEQSTQTLKEQTYELDAQQQTLNLLQYNLQEIVAAKTSEAEQKSEMLKAFAFVNAHKVRAPLARVLGLLNLLEMECSNHDQKKQFDYIRREVEQMDEIIGKINEVVN